MRESVIGKTKVMHTRHPSAACFIKKLTYLREVVPAVRTGQHEWQGIHKIDAGFLDFWRGAHWVVLSEAVHCPPSVGPEDARVSRSAISFIEYSIRRERGDKNKS